MSAATGHLATYFLHNTRLAKQSGSIEPANFRHRCPATRLATSGTTVTDNLGIHSKAQNTRKLAIYLTTQPIPKKGGWDITGMEVGV